MDTVTFLDGRTFTVGDRVRLSRDGNNEGSIVKIRPGRVCRLFIDCGDPTTEDWNRYRLPDGTWFDRARDHGVSGGCIVEVLE